MLEAKITLILKSYVFVKTIQNIFTFSEPCVCEKKQKQKKPHNNTFHADVYEAPFVS